MALKPRPSALGDLPSRLVEPELVLLCTTVIASIVLAVTSFVVFDTVAGDTWIFLLISDLFIAAAMLAALVIFLKFYFFNWDVNTRALRQFGDLLLRTRFGVLVCEVGDGEPGFSRIVYANPAMEALTGFKAKELIGRSPRILQGPGTDPRTWVEMGKAIAQKKPGSFIARYYGRDGQPYWSHVDLVPVQGRRLGKVYFAAFQRDVTELMKLREDLDRNRELLEIAKSIVDLGFWSIEFGPDGSKLWLSSEARTLLGLAPELAYLTQDDLAGCLNHADRITLTRSLGVARRDGRRFEIVVGLETSARRLQISGKSRNAEQGALRTIVSGAMRDVTDTENEMQALREARQNALSAIKAQTEFLPMLSHELRTPLNAVIGYAELCALLRRDGSELVGRDRLAQYYEAIASAGHHMTKIVDFFLEASSSELGEMRLNETQCCLKDCVAEVLSDIEPQRGSTVIECTPGDVADLSVRGDKTLLRQCLTNLILNALTHAEGHTRIDIVAMREDGGLRVDVRDNGRGVSPRVVSQLGRPFNRDNRPEIAGPQGLGMGLYITHKIMTLHGGQLILGLASKGGTVASLKLPASRIFAGEPS